MASEKNKPDAKASSDDKSDPKPTPKAKEKTIYIGGNKFKGTVPKNKLPKGIEIKK